MVRIRPLPLLLALYLGLASTAGFAANDPYSSTPSANHSSGDNPKGETAGDGSSVNSPGGKDNDSSDTGADTDAADGTTGGSNNTGEATGTGAGSSGGTSEDSDSR